MDEKDIRWRTRSEKYKFEQPRQQLDWGKGIPMFLDMYFFPF
jgi:hypothetical protein